MYVRVYAYCTYAELYIFRKNVCLTQIHPVVREDTQWRLDTQNVLRFSGSKKSGHKPPEGLDNKTDRLMYRQS
jgi:hypothetical protein